MVAAARAGWLITAGDDGFPVATLLPLMWRGSRVIAHMARANGHHSQIRPGTPGLIIVTGAQAYVSPSWYPAKAEHGRVVPTWNYTAVHLTGTVTIHDDADWVRDAVTDLTDVHERGRCQPWQVSDAPDAYVDAQLRGIVGVEFAISRVEGKAKLSQNRSVPDQRGVVAGLRADADSGYLHGSAAAQARELADQMAETLAAATDMRQ